MGEPSLGINDLSAFLVARAAEDKADATTPRAVRTAEAIRLLGYMGHGGDERLDRVSSQTRPPDLRTAHNWGINAGHLGAVWEILRIFAVIYEDHPDFREEWRV